METSPLKYQTRCVRCYPDGTGFALSSMEDQVAVEFFDLSKVGQARKYVLHLSVLSVTEALFRYAFKCHRKPEVGKDIDILSTPLLSTRYMVDLQLEDVTGTQTYRMEKTRNACTRVGCMLAVASSYTYEYGNNLHEPDGIFVRNNHNIEVNPKPKAYPTPVYPKGSTAKPPLPGVHHFWTYSSTTFTQEAHAG